MDYKEKYEKAIGRAGAAYGTGAYDDATLEFIFPELAENEDDRIRKFLIETLSHCSWRKEWPFGPNEVIAWLEKQKEQKPVEWSEVELEFRGEKVKVKRPFFRDDKGRGYSTTEQDDDVAWYALRAWCEKKGVSMYDLYPRAEWSDEDEEMRGTCIDLLEHFPRPCGEVIGPWKDCITWLKSLRPKPKQEWSDDYREEDIQTRFAFYTYKDDPSVLYLSNVFVEEASRNHGFGSKILRAAEKVAETIGAITIRLKVKQDSPANTWYRKNGYGYVAFEDGYDWLEKNLEYLKPNKPEWSEEDEENFKWFDKFFRAESILIDGKDIPQDKYLWFKSLRPQPNTVSVENATKFGNLEYERGVKDGIQHAENHQWKPTEEQMEALKCAILDVARFSKRGGRQVEFENEPYYMALHSLYEHLKKSYSI